MSLSLFTEECMMKPVGNCSVHTNDLKLCSSSTTGSGTRSRIFEAASDGEEKHWLPSLVLYQKWSVPVSFIITAHSQVSKWVGGNGSRQQHNFFPLLLFRHRNQCIGVYSENTVFQLVLQRFIYRKQKITAQQ